jgi:hypothetical protein
MREMVNAVEMATGKSDPIVLTDESHTINQVLK